MNWRMPTHRVHWSMGSVWFYFRAMEYLFLLEFFFIFICITVTDSHTGQRWATREGGRNIQYLHMFFRGQWGLHFQDRAQPLFETTWTDVRWSVFYGAGLCRSGRLSVSEHICPLWALLLKIIGKGVHQPNRHQHETRDGWFFLFGFVLMGHMALPQQGVFDLMLEFFHDGM